MYDISSAIFNQNGKQIIEAIEKVNNSGIDLKKFYSDIIHHFRNYIIIKTCGKETLAANITEMEKEKILSGATNLSSGFINNILQILLDKESIVNYSSHTKIAIEMVLLKLLEVNPGAQIDKIISKLDFLSKHLDSTTGQTSHNFKPVQKFDANKAVDNKSQVVKEPVATAQFQSTHGPANEQKSDTGKRTWQDFLKKIEQKFPFMFVLLSKDCTKEENSKEIVVGTRKLFFF